jgi:PAS domain S-box-containing protein
MREIINSKGEKRLHEDLKASENKYRQLVEKSLQGIVILQNLKIVYTNPAFIKMIGYTLEELTSLNLKQILSLAHKDDREKMWGNYNYRLKGLEVPPHYKFRLICKDGKTKMMDVYANLTEYEGKPAIQALLLDVTAEIEAKEALNRSERNYRFLIENQTDFLVELDYECKFTFVSPSYYKLIGKVENQILNKSFFDFIAEEDRKPTSEIMKSLDFPPYTCYVEHKVSTVQGIRWLAWQLKAIIDENGEIITIVSTGHDITELKEYEVNLKNRNKYIETILNNLPIGVAVNEIQSGTINFLNKEFQSIFGYEQDEIPDIKSFINKIYDDKDYKKQLTSRLNSFLKSKKPENLFWNKIEINSKSGEKKFISTKTIPLYDQNLMISTLQDITEQVRIENSLENSLKEKETLLREIHHRVKNNLQTISSLLDLQAENISDPSTLESFRSSQSRIRSMALIHERLYKSENLSRIKAREYIQSLTDYLEGTYIPHSTEINLLNDVDNFLLNLDLAIPCGLIINELVSNSMKYAFNNKSTGTILISLKVLIENEILLSVKDDGLGIPEVKLRSNSQSLGLQLVDLFVQQLKGKINFSSNGGTDVQIVFPKPPFVHILKEEE